MTRRPWSILAIIVLLAGSLAETLSGASPQAYKNFKVSVFIPVQVVERMGHSYLDQPPAVRVIGGFTHIRNLANGTTLNGDQASHRCVQ